MMRMIYDKVLHFLAGYAIAHAADMGCGDAWEFSGLLAASTAGGCKEVYDKVSGKGNAETLDAVATALGGLAYHLVKVIFE